MSLPLRIANNALTGSRDHNTIKLNNTQGALSSELIVTRSHELRDIRSEALSAPVLLDKSKGVPP